MAHNNIAVNFLKRKEYDKAIKEFELSLQYDANNTNALYNVGVAYFQLEQYDKAIDIFKKLLVLKPDDAYSYYHIGVSLSQESKTDEAIEYYIKAIELKTDFVEARANLAMIYLNKDDKSRFNEQLSEIEKFSPDVASMVKKTAKIPDTK